MANSPFWSVTDLDKKLAPDLTKEVSKKASINDLSQILKEDYRGGAEGLKSPMNAIARRVDKMNDIPVVTEDPFNPQLNDCWILRTPADDPDPETMQLCVKGTSVIFRVSLT
jgi:hypothetical protein